MPSKTPALLLRLQYEEAADEYMQSLQPEHYVEATSQATQRKITLESLDLVHAQRPDVHVFNELLVQYPVANRVRLAQVVPDNMVVVHEQPLKVEGSFDVPLQPARPFWALEYVSRTNKRKDYEENRHKYEKELKVPYYSMFLPDLEEMILFRHNRRRFVTVAANRHGRVPIKELELELGVQDGWMRFWFRGELLPLPGELLQQLTGVTRELQAERQARRALEAEVARLKARLAKSPKNGG